MRPTLLELDGVFSYRTYQSVDLSTLEFAAIVGDNGAGKSSMFEAMLFALFGTVEGSNLDMVISTGLDEGKVGFEFEFDGFTWRITRTRTRNKKTTAQIFKWNPEDSDWDVVAEGSVRAVDLEIQRLLKIDEMAFRSTVLLSQNEAGAFSSATPTERKNILSKIIGLDRYKVLEATAKTKVSERQTTINNLYAKSESQEKIICNKFELEQEFAQITKDLQQAEKDFNENEEKAERAEEQRKDHMEALNNLRHAIELRERDAEADLRSITLALNDLHESSRNEKQKLESINKEIEDLSSQVTSSEKWEKIKQETIKKIGDLEIEENTIVENGQSQAEILNSSKSELMVKEEKRSSLLEKLHILQPASDQQESETVGECWICGAHLDGATHQNLVDETKNEIDQLAEEITKMKEKIGSIEENVQELRQKLKSTKSGIEQSRTTLEKANNSINATSAATKLLSKAETTKKETVEALGIIQEKISKTEIEKENVATDTELQKAKEKLEEAERQLVDFPGGGRHRALAAQAAATIRNLSARKAVVEDRLLNVTQAEKDLAEINAELKKEQEIQGRYAQLVKAFGKDGIPALIYSGVVDELNDHINSILDNLSEGKFSVELVTTKETKKGSLSETLEVMIDAPDGNRPYVSFSGGEKFRIDIAIRLGLARLLTNRHGAKMEFLAIDEGWGALDPQGVAAMIAELNNLRSEFPLILTVTHIDTIRDEFSSLINVEKTAGGSTIAIMN